MLGEPRTDSTAPQLRPMRSDSTDLELLRSCFARNSARERSRESLEWLYFRNPGQALYVELALGASQTSLAAMYASLPGRVQVGHGAPRIALQSLDTLTDSEHRGRGLFIQLARRLYDRAAAEGVAYIYGFPNANSAHGFFDRLGWTRLDPVPFLVRPLRLAYFAERLKLPSRLLSWVPKQALVVSRPPADPNVLELDRADARLTRLWEGFARGANVRFAILRDEPYFSWRIFQKPGEQYRTIAMQRGEELSALCTFTTKVKHGGRIGYVMELLALPDAAADARRLLQRAVHAMADEGADSILAWCFSHSPTYSTFLRNAFFPLPERVRPIELHFGARAFDPALAPAIARKENWYLSYLDADTV